MFCSTDIEKQAKDLWNKTFGDSKEYIDNFFSLYFKEGNFFHIEKEGKLLSMLFATHHRLKINEEILPIAYIGSICTLEEERGKGLATQLIKKAEEDLKNLGKKGFILIAAHEGLVPFYEKMGYQLCGAEGIIMKSTFNEENLSNYSIEKVKDFDYDFIKKVQEKRNRCIIHDETTLKLYTMTDYEIINLYKENTLVAQGVVIPDFSPIEVLDCFCFEKLSAEIFSEMIYKEKKREVRLKHFPSEKMKINSTIEMAKGIKNEVFMTLNLDT
jgi:predicted acetyltransferase